MFPYVLDRKHSINDYLLATEHNKTLFTQILFTVLKISHCSVSWALVSEYYTPIFLKKIMCRQCQFFGHVARGSAGKELRECAKSSDKNIGRGRRKIRWINTVSEMTGEKGIEKNLK